MITQVVTLEAPCAWINANDRIHWRTKARLTAIWRAAAGWKGKADRVATLRRAHVSAVLWFRTAHARDAANYHPTIKAVIDGLVTDAGFLPDDNDQFMTGPFLFTGDKATRPWLNFVGVQVTFTELAALPTSFPDGPGRTNRARLGTAHGSAAVLDSREGTDRAAQADGALPVEDTR